jgi:hypothetical protein
MRLVAALIFGLGVAASASAQGPERFEFFAFHYFADAPEILYFEKPLIEEGDSDHLWFVLDVWNPRTRTLVINNAGGDTDEAIVMADIIRSRELDTHVPEGAVCYSACPLLFFAGVGRLAEGRLGVHQGVLGTGAIGTIEPINVIFTTELLRLSGSPAVLARQEATPPDQIYVFSPEELTTLGINRTRVEGLARLEAEAFVEPPRVLGRPLSGQPEPVGPLRSIVVTRLDEAGRTLDPIPGFARWGIFPTEPPQIMISLEMPALDQRLSIYFTKIYYPELPFVDYQIIITGSNGDTFDDLVTVAFQRPGEPPYKLKYMNMTPVVGDNYFDIYLPRTLSNLNFDDLAEAEFLVFDIWYLDGTELRYPIPIGTGDTALGRAIAAWRP